MSESDKAEDKTHELFVEQTQRTNDLLAELVEQNKQTKAAPKKAEAEKPAEKTYTREELQKLVDDDRISQGQMIEQLVYQGMTTVAARLRTEYADALANERKRGTVEAKLSAYKVSIPGLMQKNSDERKRATDAFQELVDDGHDPEDMRTELLALRIAFPDGDKAPAETPKETTSKRQRSVETPGSRTNREEKGSSNMKWPSFVEDFRIAYYEEGIRKGRYTGREDPMLKKELEVLEKRHKAKAA
jgi:hypothetical protein